jgi:hypothetical protein
VSFSVLLLFQLAHPHYHWRGQFLLVLVNVIGTCQIVQNESDTKKQNAVDIHVEKKTNATPFIFSICMEGALVNFMETKRCEPFTFV